MTAAHEKLIGLCKRLEAYQTPAWAIDAILDVELTTDTVLDPCAGLGLISDTCLRRGLSVEAFDVEDWHGKFPGQPRPRVPIQNVDFLGWTGDLTFDTVIMNPPFSLAEEFVDHALALNARKVICFQRQAWRESVSRRQWWEKTPPVRVWVCGARATCWRFDLLEARGHKGGSAVSMAWYVWERGHKPAEVTSAIYPRISEL